MHSGDIPTETVIYPLYQCCFPCCFPCFPAHGWLMMQDIKTSPDYHPDHRISILGAANQCFKLRHGWPSHLDQLEAGLPSRFAGSPKSCKDPKSRASKRKIWADRAGVDKASAPGHEIPSWDPSRLLKKLLDIMPHTATAQSQKSKMPKVLQKDKRYVWGLEKHSKWDWKHVVLKSYHFLISHSLSFIQAFGIADPALRLHLKHWPSASQLPIGGLEDQHWRLWWGVGRTSRQRGCVHVPTALEPQIIRFANGTTHSNMTIS